MLAPCGTFLERSFINTRLSPSEGQTKTRKGSEDCRIFISVSRKALLHSSSKRAVRASLALCERMFMRPSSDVKPLSSAHIHVRDDRLEKESFKKLLPCSHHLRPYDSNAQPDPDAFRGTPQKFAILRWQEGGKGAKFFGQRGET